TNHTGLGAGTYQVAIRDAAHTDCEIDLDGVNGTVIDEPVVLSATVTPSDVTCNSGSDGSIVITNAAGGSLSYEYTINGGTTWSTTTNHTGLGAGTYQVAIRDAAHTDCEIDLDGVNGTVIDEPVVLSATVTP
ncbi:MAG: SprB repeat-containing protein, partial [Ignavibacteria bacterium]